MNNRSFVPLLALVLLAGCGGSSEEAADSAPAESAPPTAATTTPATTAASVSTAAATNPPTTAAPVGTEAAVTGPSATTTAAAAEATVLFEDPEPVGGRATVTQNADGTRTVATDWGDVVVPAEPQRILSVSGDIDFETMLALGITPIAAGTQGGTVEEGFAPHLDGLTDGVERLPWSDGTPIEQIAVLGPDLILTWDDGETAQLLNEIAPTVPRGAWDGHFKQDLRYVAAVLGRSADAEQLLADLEARADELETRIDAGWGADATVAAAQIYDGHDQVGVDGPLSFSTELFNEVGLDVIELSNSGDDYGVDVSLEKVDEIDADHLFWQVRQDINGEPDQAGIDVVTNSPLWDLIPAVEADQVYYVDNRPWYFPTILGANVILTDIEEALDASAS